MKKLNSTANQILDRAEHYTQTKGFNAFSYKDIQNEIGIKTSSIHYYFPTKNDLAFSMTERYIESFRNVLKTISNEQRFGINRLRKLGKVYANLSNQGQFCLCGMLATELASLSEPIASLVNEFFRLNHEWVSDSTQLAIEQGKTICSVNPTDYANLYLAAIQGGMLIELAKKNRSGELEQLIENIIAQIEAKESLSA